MSRDIEVQRLHTAWKKALSIYFVNTDDEHASSVEDDARNALVDFVEANDLNGSHWDPRGPIPEDTIELSAITLNSNAALISSAVDDGGFVPVFEDD